MHKVIRLRFLCTANGEPCQRRGQTGHEGSPPSRRARGEGHGGCESESSRVGGRIGTGRRPERCRYLMDLRKALGKDGAGCVEASKGEVCREWRRIGAGGLRAGRVVREASEYSRRGVERE